MKSICYFQFKCPSASWENSHEASKTSNSSFLILAVLTLAIAFNATASFAQTARPVLEKFIDKVQAQTFHEEATSYGSIKVDVPVAPILVGGEAVGYAFVTSDFVGTTGYSGKPIHVMAAIDLDGKLLGAELVEHSEPIVLIGIPDSKIKKN